MDAWKARIAAEPANIGLHLQFAEVLTSALLLQQAVEVIEGIRDRFPQEPRIHWELAQASWRRSAHHDDGRPRKTLDKKYYLKARMAFEHFLRLAPDDPRAPQARANLDQLRQADFGRR